MSRRSVRDQVILIFAIILAAFLIISLLASIILRSSSLWEEVFDLVNILAGALFGFITGGYVYSGERERERERRREERRES